ncbi:MAG: hypothetical protein PWP10_2472 [Clostridiales bacterium]|jgi:hypothetical protein|nr:hypothetical protein [Clostridiales bacterium]
MALKEGRCPNCGSILTLEDKSEKGHCLFCDAVFENAKAFDIAANPEGVEFPNEEQPKYEGPSLDPVVRNNSIPAKASAPARDKKPSARRAPVQAEAYVHKDPIKLPEVKLSKRTRIQLALITVIAIGLIAGIGVPTVTKRDNDRQQIIEKFASELKYDVSAEQAIAVRHIANDYALIALPEDVTAEEAAEVFKTYCDVRADIRGEADAGFAKVYGGVSMKLIMPAGGFKIEEPADQTELDSGSNIISVS